MNTGPTWREREQAVSRDEILSRIRDDLLAPVDDVLGIIVFGTFARGEAWRDVDVLVVLESLERGNDAWVEAASSLGQAINLY